MTSRSIKHPKPPDAIQRWLDKHNGPALKALDRLADQTALQVRWRLIALNAPIGSRVYQMAQIELRKASEAQWKSYATICRALGGDPDEDAPQPERHWDANA